MNAVLFQFIEQRKIPWNAARRNNTQMEKEKTGDAGIKHACFDRKQALLFSTFL